MSITQNNNFEHDLKIGLEYEGMFANILRGKTVEIKTDLIAHKTGNVAIEFEYRNKPSGISKTNADYYAFIFPNAQVGTMITLIETNELKAFARKYYADKKNIKCVGDDKAAKVILIPLQRFLRDVITSN
jgi:hypothetical protein